MKLIDKYLLKSFAVPLMYCLLAFAMLYIVYDLFDNMPDFVEAKTPLGHVALFYLFLLPSVLIIIAPVSLLLSVLYSLSDLTKTNELTAMRASGISLLRLVTPFISVGLLFSLLVGAIHETIGPWSSYWTHQFVRQQRHKGSMAIHVATALGYVNELADRDWIIERFDTRTYEMENVTVTETQDDGSSIRYQARRANWLDGRWWFSELVVQEFDQHGNPRIGVPPQFIVRREMIGFTETPRNFMNEVKDPLQNPEFLSVMEMKNFLATHRLSEETITRIRVDMQHRMAMPWMCLIVTLIGIPFGSQTGRKGALLGISLALTLFLAYYLFVNVGLALGKKQLIEPWLAGWAGNIFFFISGSILVYRMR